MNFHQASSFILKHGNLVVAIQLDKITLRAIAYAICLINATAAYRRALRDGEGSLRGKSNISADILPSLLH